MVEPSSEGEAPESDVQGSLPSKAETSSIVHGRALGSRVDRRSKRGRSGKIRSFSGLLSLRADHLEIETDARAPPLRARTMVTGLPGIDVDADPEIAPLHP